MIFMPPNQRRGVALITVLSFVAIISLLLVTLMIVTRNERSASRNYSQSIKAEELARGGIESVVFGLIQEIKAGSSAHSTSNGRIIYKPTKKRSIVPAALGASTSLPNLVQRSLADNALFNVAYPTSDYDSSLRPLNYASPVNSSALTINGRTISLGRWNKPRLADYTSSNQTPDWIIVTRNGPEQFTAWDARLADKSSPQYALGRYAYAIYSVGGLVNANIAGFAVNNPPAGSTFDPHIQSKGSQVWTKLQAIGLNQAQIDALVRVRNPLTSKTAVDYLNHVLQTGGPGGFLNVFGNAAGSDSVFLGRQDLIKFAEDPDLDGSTGDNFRSALPLLTTFSREINSPVIPAGTDPALNPDFTLFDDVSGNKPLPRFPLSRFKLLTKDPATLTSDEEAQILNYFGLTKKSASSSSHSIWTYRSALIGSPTAAISGGRDPDLFELVKAAIANPSLGVKAENNANNLVHETGSTNYTPEQNVQHQIARIIANMIDQYDSDNYPTTIEIGSNAVYGIESLPYFSEMLWKAHFPAGFNFPVGTANPGAIYAYFELWNPHQGVIPATGPSNIRIVVNNSARMAVNYTNFGSFRPVNSAYPPFPATVPFPSTPIVLNNLPYYQSQPRIALNSADSASYITALDTPFNGWRVLAVDQRNTLPGGLIFTALQTSNLALALQYEDAGGNWRTYTTFAGHYTGVTDSGATAIQNGGPFMNNNNGGGASGNNQVLSANTSFAKIDPRTFRFRFGITTGDPTPAAAMAAASFPGQSYDQNRCANTPSQPGNYLLNTSSANGVADLDGIYRPGDGYLDTTVANPMTSGSNARPIILNRPFRSVAELGHVFRDAPWKSLDFFSPESADAALLDLFCLYETDVQADRIDLNTLNPQVLKALLVDTSREQANGTLPITDGEADAIANRIIALRLVEPFLNNQDLVTRLYRSPAPPAVSTTYPAIKSRRESIQRALATSTQTRTWNLMIDIIAQSGSYPAAAGNLTQFRTEGERRYWLHLSIDRYTGSVTDRFLEPVYE
jgi:hypothetical protein